MAVEMVIVDGIRYRPEDAKRLGLVADKPETEEKAAPQRSNKARKPANKSTSEE
jgi:hypothetical protein